MKCRECEGLMFEALYEELSENEKASFNTHLRDCSACTEAYREMSGTLKVMNQRVRKEPDAAFWENYWNNLAPKLQQLKQRPEERKIFSWPRVVPGWTYQVAAALVLILLGVIIGKIYFSKPEGPPQIVRTPAPETSIVKTAANERAHSFLQRSELLILGLVNSPSSETVDVGYSRKVSGELIREAKLIEPTLTSPEQRKLRRLISDLEIILLQIANLEAEQDMPEIDMVKSGAEKTAILLQINLELMRANRNGANKKTEDVEASGNRKL